jgi:NAD(P)-dependent dehydrogenase (short-subunit alcohol dehydrogenase family)
VVIVGVGSGIGHELALRFHRDGFVLVGTYRTEAGVEDLRDLPGTHLYQCDILDEESVSRFTAAVGKLGVPWDILVSSVGSQEPIGRFFDVDVDEWVDSVHVNALAQLRVVHRLRRWASERPSVAFFAGGGTNNPMPRYSAYCVSKIALIKMCELLDDEDPELNVFIVGPGWTRTKIHQQTLSNPDGAGGNYLKTRRFVESGDQGTPMSDIYDCVSWLVAKGRSVAGGRNFSVVHDRWGDRSGSDELIAALASDASMYKLRRHANSWKPRQP